MDIKQKYTRNRKKIGTGTNFSAKNRTSPIFFLVGPTAVGKTEVSVKLAGMINAEVISCDSMQVYKDMDIISQKPSSLKQKQAPHHMIDIISPSQNFNVANYRKKALKIIKDIHKKGKIPLLVGGSALYMKVLIDGLFPSPKPDLKLRGRLKKESEFNEKDYLYKRLKRIDPETAGILHPNDTRRIIRALEVYFKTGIPMSELKKKTEGLKKNYNIKVFCLNRPREQLYDRINKRIDRMFKQGIIAECKRLKDRKLSLSASQVLGCKEIFAYLDKKCTKVEVKQILKRNTRRFAKRQLSWFRNEPDISWIDINNNEGSKETAERIVSLFRLCRNDSRIKTYCRFPLSRE